MCGFVGLFGNINALEKDFIRPLKNSLNLIHHRGPNSTKTLQLKNFLVGFKRLAIQDLSHRANQPMVSHDKRFTILFNGNIHNFKKIKENLIKKKKNLKFNSTSDTEVLLQLFLIKKHKMLKYLEGHFSIIIHDNKKNEIFISNDRFGQKPLYYIIHNNIFFFASEIKAFLPIVKKFNIPWKINKNLINEYLTYRCNLGQNTLIECVKKFKNGYYAYLNLKDGLKYYKYFSLNLNSFNNNKKITLKRKKAYIEKFKQLFNNSVKDQLISDVPVGLTLSGGLDSSLILKFISKNTQLPVECYHVRFNKIKKDRFSDESIFAKKVVNEYGGKLNIINYNYKDYLKDFKKSIWFNDHPLSIPHTPALYKLFQVASKKISVMLSGEGADEIFAGYNNFLRNEKNFYSTNLFSNPKEIKKILNSQFYKKDNIERLKFQKKIKEDNINSKIIYSIQSQLPHLLNRLDKMSMASAVEARLPFLDENLFKFSQNLPISLKVDKKNTKIILKKASEEFFSNKFIYRKKNGFSLPINQWMKKKKFQNFFIKILCESKTLKRGIYNNSEIKKLIKDLKNKKDKKENSMTNKIWMLVNLELWIRIFFENDLKVKL